MPTAAEILRRKRGLSLEEEADAQSASNNALVDSLEMPKPQGEMVLPELDYSEEGGQLVPVGSHLKDQYAMNPADWKQARADAKQAQIDAKTPTVSEPVVTRGVRTDKPSAMTTEVTPLEPVINERVPNDRRSQLLAAIQRTSRAPEMVADETPAETKGEPFTVNGEVAKLATGAAVPPAAPTLPAPAPVADPQVDERALRREMYDAQEADRKSHLTAGMELAARQLVGGITRTDVPQGIGAAPSQVPLAQADAAARRKAVAEAIARKRQSQMDASTLDLQASEAEKNRRLPADKVAQPTSNRTEEDRLRAEKLQLDRDKFEAKQKPKPSGVGSGGADVLAEAIASGKAPPPGTRQKDYASVMARVRKIRPDYDESQWKTYQHTRENQATNPGINAAKAVTHHIGMLRDSIGKLPDSFDSPGFNAADQWAHSKLGTSKYTTMQTEADIVAAEMAQALGEKDVEGRAMVKHLVRHDQTKAEWLKSLDALEKLRDEKLGVYSDTLKDLGPQQAAPREYVKRANGYGYFYENGELHKEKAPNG